MKKLSMFFVLVLLATSCASYDEYIQLSKEILENPREKTLELIDDTSRVTSGYSYPKKAYGVEKTIKAFENMVNKDFQADSVELYDIEKYSVNGPTSLENPQKDFTKWKVVEISFINKNNKKYLIIFQFDYDKKSDKYKLNMIKFANLEVDTELRK